MSLPSSPSACITGGARGIGAAIARRLLARGARVTLLDFDASAGAATAAAFNSEFGAGRAIFVSCDVSQPGALASAMRAAVAHGGGKLDVMVNNAGLGERTQITEDAVGGGSGGSDDDVPADWDAVVRVNLSAVLLGTRLAVRQMRAQAPRGGVIINVASLGGFIGQPYSPIYCATKHAVVGFTRSLGGLRREGVRVAAIAPGFTDTQMVRQGVAGSAAFRAVIAAATGGDPGNASAPGAGLLTVDHIAEAAMMVCDDASYAGNVLSISQELGYALHATPMLFTPPGAAPAGVAGANVSEQQKSRVRVVALPHKIVKPLNGIPSVPGATAAASTGRAKL